MGQFRFGDIIIPILAGSISGGGTINSRCCVNKALVSNSFVSKLIHSHWNGLVYCNYSARLFDFKADMKKLGTPSSLHINVLGILEHDKRIMPNTVLGVKGRTKLN